MTIWNQRALYLAVCLLFACGAYAQDSRPDLLVSSPGTDSVKRYDGETGAYKGDFIQPRSGGLDRTQDLLYGPDGNLYVSGFATSAVLKFDPITGVFIERFTSNRNIAEATKMAFHSDGMLYISQWAGDEKVLRFDAITGVYVDAFTSRGVVNGMEFDWDAEGNFIIASWGQNGTDGTVQRFDSEGNFVDILVATNNGGLQGPVNLWIDGTDLFVVDWTRGLVLRYHVSTGEYLGVYASGMTRSEGYVFDVDGNLYVPDWQQNKINRYDQDGNFIDTFASSGGMTNPNAVMFESSSSQSVGNETGELPATLFLAQNYPNPFSGSTLIEYSISQTSSVELTVFNILGKQVRTFSRGIEQAGFHQIEWDGSSDGGEQLPSGSYFLIMQAGEGSVTRLVTLIE